MSGAGGSTDWGGTYGTPSSDRHRIPTPVWLSVERELRELKIVPAGLQIEIASHRGDVLRERAMGICGIAQPEMRVPSGRILVVLYEFPAQTDQSRRLQSAHPFGEIRKRFIVGSVFWRRPGSGRRVEEIIHALHPSSSKRSSLQPFWASMNKSLEWA
jgi:hypothetical protein